jgi:hypothetical protein
MIHPLPFAEADFAAYGERLGISDTGRAARYLAAAIASSVGWERYPGCTLLVREEPAALAIVGELALEAREELSAQADALRSRCRHFRYLSYQQAEVDCLRLAEQLGPLLRSPGWEVARLLAIPRGGHLVLGMLATLLDLPRERLLPTPDPSVPAVIVDDCAMTGTRFREFLSRLPAQRVAFAHLYSRPELRSAIRAAEPRVVACLTAHDLAALPVDDPTETNWWDRLPGEAYLRVPSEVACFAWSEPDRVIRTSAGAILPGWRMIPPELCLKNRRPGGLPLELQNPGAGPLRPGRDVFFTDNGEVILAAGGTSGVVVRMEGLAAAAWRAVLATGDAADAEARLAAQFEVDPPLLHRDLRVVLDDLLTRRLLSPPEPSTEADRA